MLSLKQIEKIIYDADPDKLAILLYQSFVDSVSTVNPVTLKKQLPYEVANERDRFLSNIRGLTNRVERLKYTNANKNLTIKRLQTKLNITKTALKSMTDEYFNKLMNGEMP